MNRYENIGKDFLTKLDEIVKKNTMEMRESLFKVLDHVHLKDGFRLWLYLAKEQGIGDESAFYTFKDEGNSFEEQKTIVSLSSIGNCLRLFKGLEIG